MGRARVLLAEDHRVVAERLRDMLEAEYEVVATLTNGFELLGAARVFKPDVIVTDIAMPGLDGLRAAEILLADDPSMKIVVISVHDDAALMKRAQEIGILGYVLKSGGCANLLAAVAAALKGKDTNSQLGGQQRGPS